ncbi:MAG: DUF2760 domain-containing protein [Lentisphaeria bacterium]|nr:DUF2760 domain-containing protein [Lentisphaeria bacterium]
MGRFGMAWSAFWAILRSPEWAERWRSMARGAAAPAPGEESPAAVGEGQPVTAAAGGGGNLPADAVYTLALFQREGRLVDFLQEQIDSYADAQVGAAARQIHEGCRRVLHDVFTVAPVRSEDEGSRIEIETDFDPRALRVTGRTGDDPPRSGVLRHRGWRVTAVSFPRRHGALDPSIICPAEVEV